MEFPNPFPGKPAPLNISGLFLLDPSVHTKLFGVPFRVALERQIGAALYKRMDRAIKQEKLTTALLNEVMDALPDGNAFLDSLRLAIGGDVDAAAAMDAVGAWETMYAACPDPLGYCRSYRIEVERACRIPTDTLRKGDFREGVKQLFVDPVTSTLLWPEAVQALDGRTALKHLAALQFAVAMEVELSCVAALDVQYQVEGSHEDSLFSCLLPAEDSSLNPSALFFRWLQGKVGVSTIDELACRLELTRGRVHLVTLKNWSRGARLPSEAWLQPIVELCPALEDDNEIWKLLWATKLLTLIGYYATMCVSRASAQVVPEARTLWRPWPAFPYGFSSYGDWVRESYPQWLAYHRFRIR